MTTTNPLALDLDALAQLYVPLQPIGKTDAWWYSNEGQASSLYASQCGEYILNQPTFSASVGPASSDVAQSLSNLLGQIGPALAGVDDALAQALTEWSAQVTAGEDQCQLVVTALLTCYNVDKGDDKSTITLTYLYCLPLDQALLVYHSVSTDWAGGANTSVEGGFGVVVDSGAHAGQIANLMKSLMRLADATAEAVPGLDAVATIGLACFAVYHLGKLVFGTDDIGARTNLIGETAHAFARISACVSPRSTPVQQLMAVNPAAMQVNWSTETMDVALPGIGTSAQAYQQLGSWFQLSPAQFQVVASNDYWNTETTRPYSVGMPSVSWSNGGSAWTLATSRIYVDGDGDSAVAIAILVLSPVGVGVSYAMQRLSGNGQIIAPDPAWYFTTSTTELPSGFAGEVEDDVALLETESTACLQLTLVVPSVVSEIMGAATLAPRSGSQPSIGFTLDWNSDVQVDTDKNASSIAARLEGDVLIVFDDHSLGNISKVKYRHGSLLATATQITFASDETTQEAGSGAYPAVGSHPRNGGQSFLEVHNYSNEIYRAIGAVSGDSVDFGDNFDGDSSQIGPKDHPAVYFADDGLVAVMSSDSGNTLWYYLAYFDGVSSWQPRAAIQITDWDADFPTIVLDTRSMTVVVAYESNGQIWYTTGTVTNSDFSGLEWGPGPFPLGQSGTHPHLALFPGGGLLLTYTNGSDIYAAAGQLEDGLVRWYLTNQRVISGGDYAAIQAVPTRSDTDVTMSWTNSMGTIYARVGKIVLPS